MQILLSQASSTCPLRHPIEPVQLFDVHARGGTELLSQPTRDARSHAGCEVQTASRAIEFTARNGSGGCTLKPLLSLLEVQICCACSAPDLYNSIAIRDDERASEQERGSLAVCLSVCLYEQYCPEQSASMNIGSVVALKVSCAMVSQRLISLCASLPACLLVCWLTCVSCWASLFAVWLASA